MHCIKLNSKTEKVTPGRGTFIQCIRLNSKTEKVTPGRGIFIQCTP